MVLSGPIVSGQLVASFEAIADPARSQAGGKGASLIRMRRSGLPVPRGFVVSAAALRRSLERTGGLRLIRNAIAELDVHSELSLNQAGTRIRQMILDSPMPDDLRCLIHAAYSELADGERLAVAVRSSAVQEDGEVASFAGQQETFLNVRGGANVVRKVQECWASFFSPPAMFYRAQKGDLSDIQIAVVVQEMIFSDKSGVLFTVDPVQRRRDYMVIEAVLGLGEGIVSGSMTPDHYVLDREDGSMFHEFVASKTIALIADLERGGVVPIDVPQHQQDQRVLENPERIKLWKLGLDVEKCFGQPQDLEWAIRGDRLFVLQSRPITTLGDLG